MTEEQTTGPEAPPDEAPAESLELTPEEAEAVDAALAELEAGEAPAEEGAEEAPGATEDRSSDPLSKVRREAAGYRVKLREAEAERDRLAGVVESMQRQEAERLVTADPIGSLAEGGDLWRGGVELSELLGEDGTLDPEKVKDARSRVLRPPPLGTAARRRLLRWRRSSSSPHAGPRRLALGAPAERRRRVEPSRSRSLHFWTSARARRPPTRISARGAPRGPQLGPAERKAPQPKGSADPCPPGTPPPPPAVRSRKRR